MSNSEWGAIPRSLANDVSNMIEKKMGTSSGYKPVEWVSQINLMGKLPIKSASGAIASFSDGADGVPVKSCTVSFLPSGGGGTPSAPVAIQGVSGLSVTKLGGNLLQNQETSRTESDVTFTVNSDGSVSLSGTASADINYTVFSNFAFPKTGNYFISGCPSGGSTSTYRIFATNYGSDTGNGLSVNVTNLATKTSVRINIKSGVNTDGLVFKPMISVGATATTYSAYVTPSVVTDTFGQTIYGGTRDLTTDKASVDMTKDTMTYAYLSGLSSSYIGYASSVPAMSNHPAIWVRNWNYSQMPTLKAGGIKCATNAFPDIRINDSNIISTQYRVYFDVTGCNISSVQDFLNAIQTMEQWGNSLEVAYELATPTEITGLTPHEIDTLYGDNNIYADTGTTEVEYRADIDLALNA